MKFKRQLIMNIGETTNGLMITKEMVLNSLDSFEFMPVIYNPKQEFKDYTEPNIGNYKKQIAIGFIDGFIEITDTEVFADVNIIDKYKKLWNGKYDNWLIDYDKDNPTKFKTNSIEVF